jgi:carbon monoxide dehydrogenase subunit G
MLIQNAFTVSRSVDDVWAYLLDVERIAPCLPGAALTDTIDDRHWKGKVDVKFGPVSMTFNGTVEMEERDDVAHRVRLRAKGMEARGKGAANATITASLEPVEDETRVSIDADMTLTGAAAQLSRGLLPEVSKRLTAQFADCLQQNLTANAPEKAASVATATAHPVGGLRLAFAAMWASIVHALRRLFGGRSPDQPAS